MPIEKGLKHTLKAPSIIVPKTNAKKVYAATLIVCVNT